MQECQINTHVPSALFNDNNYDPITPLDVSDVASPSVIPQSAEDVENLKTIQTLQPRADIMSLSEHFPDVNTFKAMKHKMDSLEAPAIVIDLDMVEQNYNTLTTTFPYGTIYYALKANPDPKIAKMLVDRGCSFDIASRYELDLILSQGASPTKCSFGNTIKRAIDIEYFYKQGVRLFATDCEQDLLNIAKYAPGASVYVRLLLDFGEATSDWPLSKKFGCTAKMAYKLLVQAASLGLTVAGVSAHPGSQQLDPTVWNTLIGLVGELYKKLYNEHQIVCSLLNLGGGLCAHYVKDAPELSVYENIITNALETAFEDAYRPKIVIFEPGRSLVGNAGILGAEVVLSSYKGDEDAADVADPEALSGRRWVYLNASVFNGLIETLGESIKYPLLAQKFTEDKDAIALCSFVLEQEQFDKAFAAYHTTGAGAGFLEPSLNSSLQFQSEDREPVILAGNTCDSCDIMYQKTQYRFPKSLRQGDRILVLSTGAYTTSYASVCFNGFPPVLAHVIKSSTYFQDLEAGQQQ